jgi:hypothetical protein
LPGVGDHQLPDKVIERRSELVRDLTRDKRQIDRHLCESGNGFRPNHELVSRLVTLTANPVRSVVSKGANAVAQLGDVQTRALNLGAATV